MRQADVYSRGTFAGLLSQDGASYRFQYAPEYLLNQKCPAIGLSLPKQRAPFESPVLFPFFFGLLAEGENKKLQCRILKIDENDHFTRLLKTCKAETIGGISIREVL